MVRGIDLKTANLGQALEGDVTELRNLEKLKKQCE